MRIVDSTRLDWERPQLRGGGIGFRTLFRGRPGEPGNFWFCLAEVLEHYETPPHRHNFDQLRWQLEGDFGYGPGRVQHAGELGFFGAGTWYRQSGEGRSLQLLLQVEGPEGEPYFGERIREATTRLRETRQLTGGRFVDPDGRSQDAFEAAWEHLAGRPVAYPEPRYPGPVLLVPERFAWQHDEQPSVWTRPLAVFNERPLSVSMLRLDPGSHWEAPPHAGTLLAYVALGAGSAEGQAWSAGCALRAAPGEALRLAVTAASELLLVQLAPAAAGASA